MNDNTNLPANVSPVESDGLKLYKVLANSPKVSVMAKNGQRQELQDQIEKIIFKACFDAGKAKWIADADFAPMAASLTEYIMRRFASITLPEIKEAVTRGLSGDYGKFDDVTVVLLNEWISKFVTTSDRLIALSRIPKIDQQLAELKISMEEKEVIGRQAFENCLEIYKRSGIIHDFGNGVYAYLAGKKILKLTKRDLVTAHNEEKDRIIEERKQANLVLNRMAVAKYDSELRELEMNWSITESLAKKKVLENYFKTLPSE